MIWWMIFYAPLLPLTLHKLFPDIMNRAPSAECLRRESLRSDLRSASPQPSRTPMIIPKVHSRTLKPRTKTSLI